MKIQFRTESGSLYEVEGDETNGGTWKRLSHSSESNDLRTAYGPYDSRSAINIGHSVIFLCPKFIPNALARVIETTPVTEIIQGG